MINNIKSQLNPLDIQHFFFKIQIQNTNIKISADLTTCQ